MKTFILGDCMNPKNGLPVYENDSFDLAIIDPPYGIGDDGRNHKGRIIRKDGTPIYKVDPRNGRQTIVKEQEYPTDIKYDDKQPSQAYFDELFRVSKHQIIWGCNYLQFDQKKTSSGRIFWDKVNGGTDQSDCEVAWTSLFKSVRQIEYMWNGFNQGESLRHPRRARGNKRLNEKRIHPNQKPVLLYKWLLRLKQVKQGCLILDTHVGSGSNLIACEIEGFDYLGFEKEKAFFDLAENRLQNYHQKKEHSLFR